VTIASGRIGGKGKIVEIDEMKLGKRKFHQEALFEMSLSLITWLTICIKLLYGINKHFILGSALVAMEPWAQYSVLKGLGHSDWSKFLIGHLVDSFSDGSA
jgi:hypothetical protein